jgi:hypothetical protein
MFEIKLSPVVDNQPDRLEISVSGHVLTVAGDVIDLSPMADGGTLPHDAVASDWITQDPITSADGCISVTVKFQIDASAPYEARFPDLIAVDADGPVTLPAQWMEGQA